MLSSPIFFYLIFIASSVAAVYGAVYNPIVGFVGVLGLAFSVWLYMRLLNKKKK